jgi:hypothetical protein
MSFKFISERKLLFVSLAIVFLYSTTLVFASGGPFAPGTQLDPNCLPTDNTCYVTDPLTPPAGATTNVQYNNAGVFGADNLFTRAADQSSFSVESTVGTGQTTQSAESGNLFGFGIPGIINAYSDNGFTTGFDGILSGDIGGGPATVIGHFDFGANNHAQGTFAYDAGAQVSTIGLNSQVQGGGQASINVGASLTNSSIGFDFGSGNNYSFPNTAPGVGQVMGYTSAHTLGWVTPSGGGGGGTIGGSIANHQIAVGSGADTIAGSSNLTYDGSGTIVISDSSGSEYFKGAGAGNHSISMGSLVTPANGVFILDQTASQMYSRYNNANFLDLAGNTLGSIRDSIGDINVQFGDLSNAYHGTHSVVNDGSQYFAVYNQTSVGGAAGLSLDFLDHDYTLGVTSVVSGNNGTNIDVNDMGQAITLTSNTATIIQDHSGNHWFDLSPGAGSVNFGNLISGTSTHFTLNDSLSQISITHAADILFGTSGFELGNPADTTQRYFTGIWNAGSPVLTLGLGTTLNVNASTSTYTFNQPNFNINGVPYVFPGAQAGAAGDILANDGSGNLSWAVPGVSTWSLTGNTGTTAGTNFIGTTDNKDFVVKTNNTQVALFASSGDVTFAKDIFLGDSYPLSNNGDNFIRLDNSYGNVIMGTLVPRLPIDNANFVGDVLIGDAAGHGIDFGAVSSRNTWVGQYTGREALDGSYDTFYGSQAGGGWIHAGDSNLVMGVDAFYATSGGTAGNYNTILGGVDAGYHASGSSNVIIGSYTSNSSAASNSIVIGYNAGSANNSNSIALGDYATNTAAHQFMVGSATSTGYISQMVIDLNSAGTQTCVIDVTGANCSSDERLKTNITDLGTSTLDDLLAVRTVNFNWINDTTNAPEIGFLAQNIIQKFPQVVSTNANGYYMVNYGEMAPVLVEAIRELNMKVVAMADLSAANNTFAQELVAWLGSATNGVADFFSKKSHTETLCVGTVGNETCITKDQLDHILQNQIQSQGGNGTTTTTSMTTGGTTNGLEVTPPVGGNGDAGSTTGAPAGTTTGGTTVTDVPPTTPTPSVDGGTGATTSGDTTTGGTTDTPTPPTN